MRLQKVNWSAPIVMCGLLGDENTPAKLVYTLQKCRFRRVVIENETSVLEVDDFGRQRSWHDLRKPGAQIIRNENT